MRPFGVLVLLVVLLGGCQQVAEPAPVVYVVVTSTPEPTAPVTPTSSVTPTSVPPPTATASTTPSPTASPTATATAIPSPTATPTYTPYCAQPPETYERVWLNGHELNARTLSMLQTAGELYGGPGNLLSLTQGSYRDVLAASFGTHAGGGAVDISIRHPQEGTFLYEEAEAMVQALRAAGFAAWYREAGALGPGSGAHLHAIAIGDSELSPAAQEQVRSYFAGMDGLIEPWGPSPDPHGGPVVCPWMALPLEEEPSHSPAAQRNPTSSPESAGSQ